MNSASVSLYKETRSQKATGEVAKCHRLEAFGMLPSSVLSLDLPPGAKVLFAGLAMLSKGHAVVAVSLPEISTACGMDRATVIRNLRRLVKAKLIERAGRPLWQVQPWKILHPRVVRREAVRGDMELPEAVWTAKRKVELVACARCRMPCVPGKTGWCRKCAGKVEMEGEIRRMVNRAITERTGSLG